MAVENHSYRYYLQLGCVGATSGIKYAVNVITTTEGTVISVIMTIRLVLFGSSVNRPI